MHNDDLIRELDKIKTALTHAGDYLAKMNESNAQLHLSDRILYSPLTVEVIHAAESVDLIVAQLATTVVLPVVPMVVERKREARFIVHPTDPTLDHWED